MRKRKWPYEMTLIPFTGLRNGGVCQFPLLKGLLCGEESLSEVTVLETVFF